MEVKIELNDMFSYTVLIMIILFIILIALLIIRLYKYPIKRKEKVKVIKPKTVDKNKIRNNYISELLKLEKDVDSKKVTIRAAYQKQSIIIRKFVYEMTGVHVNNYTLEDIKNINMPELYNLVKEYYDPEFSKISKGDVKNSINKTLEVIRKWK